MSLQYFEEKEYLFIAISPYLEHKCLVCNGLYCFLSKKTLKINKLFVLISKNKIVRYLLFLKVFINHDLSYTYFINKNSTFFISCCDLMVFFLDSFFLMTFLLIWHVFNTTVDIHIYIFSLWLAIMYYDNLRFIHFNTIYNHTSHLNWRFAH